MDGATRFRFPPGVIRPAAFRSAAGALRQTTRAQNHVRPH